MQQLHAALPAGRAASERGRERQPGGKPADVGTAAPQESWEEHPLPASHPAHGDGAAEPRTKVYKAKTTLQKGEGELCGLGMEKRATCLLRLIVNILWLCAVLYKHPADTRDILVLLQHNSS